MQIILACFTKLNVSLLFRFVWQYNSIFIDIFTEKFIKEKDTHTHTHLLKILLYTIISKQLYVYEDIGYPSHDKEVFIKRT